jgi:hypothetical protein
VDAMPPENRGRSISESTEQIKRNIWSACDHVVDEPTSILTNVVVVEYHSCVLEFVAHTLGNGIKVSAHMLLILAFSALKLITALAPRWS